MRDIKFRVWDGHKMRTDFTMHSDGQVIISASVYAIGFEPVLMQYTGLKDANGVEIYEGDIIETSGLEFSREVVKHKVDNSIQTSGHGCSDTKATSGYSIGGYYGGPDKIEVIGNIHENPELLP